VRLTMITRPMITTRRTSRLSARPLRASDHDHRAAEIPGARLVELPGVGHQMPPPEVWDVVITEVLVSQ
jgi:hypothetical protein